LKYVVIAGTRPEIIKVAPIIRSLQSSGIEFSFILTGQHYDHKLSKQMISDLLLPYPDFDIKLEKRSPASQIAEIMTRLEPLMKPMESGYAIIQGDTNSVLSASLTAVKLGIQIAHVEAGLRSYDWRMPEEHNRRMVDHISNILFAPTQQDKINLINEGVYGSVYVTGNTVIDAIREHLPIAQRQSRIMETIDASEYVLVTLHRSENVDLKDRLSLIIRALIDSSISIIFPLHPRTEKKLKEFDLYDGIMSAKNIQIVPPQGYLDFLVLMKNCKFIVTDSGGIQEEATSPEISKRVLVLRNSTERPEAISCGLARLIPLKYDEIIKEITKEMSNDEKLTIICPYGDGNTAKKIVNILRNHK